MLCAVTVGCLAFRRSSISLVSWPRMSLLDGAGRGPLHHMLLRMDALSSMESADAGVLTSDPRIVREAQPVPLLTFDEATELAFFGATVLHPSAMQPAMQHSSLDVRVKNSYNRYHLSPSDMRILLRCLGSTLPGIVLHWCQCRALGLPREAVTQQSWMRLLTLPQESSRDTHLQRKRHD